MVLAWTVCRKEQMLLLRPLGSYREVSNDIDIRGPARLAMGDQTVRVSSSCYALLGAVINHRTGSNQSGQFT